MRRGAGDGGPQSKSHLDRCFRHGRDVGDPRRRRIFDGIVFRLTPGAPVSSRVGRLALSDARWRRAGRGWASLHPRRGNERAGTRSAIPARSLSTRTPLRTARPQVTPNLAFESRDAHHAIDGNVAVSLVDIVDAIGQLPQNEFYIH